MNSNKQKRQSSDSVNQSENKDGALRRGVLEEIGQYRYGERNSSSVKRFVRSDPSKITTKARPAIKKKEKEISPTNKPAPAALPVAQKTVSNEKTGKRYSWKIWLAIGLGALVVLLVIFLWAVYRLRLDKKIPNLVYGLPLPLAYVNGSALSLHEFNSEVVTLQKYYDRIAAENGVGGSISVGEIENIVLERMIREQIVNDFAKLNNIIITTEQVNSELSAIISDFGGEDSLKEFVSTNYNWSVDDFKNKIIIPYLQREKVTEWFASNESVQIAAQDKAQQIKNDISSGAITFAEAARKYSDDLASAAQDGSLGVFAWGTMVPEFETAVKSLTIDQISEPVRTRFGWHIIRRDSLPIDTPEADNYASASHILISDFNFDKWIENEREKSKPLIFLKIDNSKI